MDVVLEAEEHLYRETFIDNYFIRQICARESDIEDGHVFLEPHRDCTGKVFMQIVLGRPAFLKASARELLPEYGWPRELGADAEFCVKELTPYNCIAAFIRPKPMVSIIMPAVEIVAYKMTHTNYPH